MDLATGAMGSLLLKLAGLLAEEYKLQTGVKEDIEHMKRELTSMDIALRKVGGVPRDELDEQVKIWADEVRDLSYVMEDIIDKFLIRVEGAEPAVKPRKFKRLMKKIGDVFTKGKTRHEISDEIKGIKVRVQEAADRRDRYKVNEVVPARTIMPDPRLLALYKDKKDLVGFDGPLNQLTNMLNDDDVRKELKIVSIFGFGGLGKTTLAKALYDRHRFAFDHSAFVPVGRSPSPKKIFNDILFEIDHNKYPELDERQLIDKLRTLLHYKRYFIVIDDIWDTIAWGIIKYAFVDNNCASWVITTTRILDVATKTGEVYNLQPLSHDLSKELFHARLFDGNSKHTSALPDKILHKCGGVPLAIITIASLLVNKPVEFWSKVYNSIGFGHEENNDVDNTRKILLFSYYDLPFHLRTCLLHLSIYPEDHLIMKDSLIWIWVAEGFIHEEPGAGEGLFQIGERYFNELINKSMLLPVEEKYHYTIIKCRIHDMVLDMICVLAKEQNFVTILDSNEQYTSSHANARRLAVGEREEPLASVPMLQVRSFNAMCSVDKLPSLSCFQVLRVLNLSLNADNGLKHLGKLVHLRYLRLEITNYGVLEVPQEIGYLKFLQVLVLAGMYKKVNLPQSIGLLTQLKCFNSTREIADITAATDWIGNLTSLEELRVGRVNDSSNFVTELGKLTELRMLKIGFLELKRMSQIKAWTESLAKLNKIQVMVIVEENHVSAEELGKGIQQDHQIILNNEMIVLKSLDFDLIVYAPYRSVQGFIDDMDDFCRAGNGAHQRLKDLHQTANSHVDRMMLTDTPLLYTPGQLALAALYKSNDALKVLDFERYLESVFSRQRFDCPVEQFVQIMNTINYLVDRLQTLGAEDMKHADRKLRHCLDEHKKKEKKPKHKSKRTASDVRHNS